LKNFAMFHTPQGLRLTPAYDLVASALHPDFKTLALSIGGASNLTLADLKPKHFVTLGRVYGLENRVLTATFEKLDSRRKATQRAIIDAAKKIDADQLGKDLLDLMEHRWNGSFASIGHFLSKKQSGAGMA
jgi:serine/threonine-protein kinase HipA